MGIVVVAALAASAAGVSGRGDHGDPSANQIGRQRRQPIDLILGPAVFDRHVLALDIAGVLQALAKCAQTVRERVRRCGVEEPDHRHRRLLRARRERPRSRRAAEQRDELAPLHSITSSARASSDGRHVEAERLRGLEVDGHFELGRRLHRQVGGLGAAQDAVDIGRRLPITCSTWSTP